jgi:hypothetical protein
MGARVYELVGSFMASETTLHQIELSVQSDGIEGGDCRNLKFWFKHQEKGQGIGLWKWSRLDGFINDVRYAIELKTTQIIYYYHITTRFKYLEITIPLSGKSIFKAGLFGYATSQGMTILFTRGIICASQINRGHNHQRRHDLFQNHHQQKLTNPRRQRFRNHYQRRYQEP